MDFRRGSAIVLTIAALAIPSMAAAKTLVVPPRPGQVGFSVQGQFGGMMATGGLGENFDFGPGLAVRLKYRMRYERAIGLSFESQTFEARSNPKFTNPEDGSPINPDTSIAPHKVTLTLSGFDVYQMFGTRTTLTRMVSGGLGVVQVHATLNDGETEFRPDGFYATVGGGIEKFFYRSLAYDLSGRYIAIFTDGGTNHEFQAALGLVFYAGY